ncbi:transcriptional activator protein [Tomato leaf curl Kunene virus]|uniref:Transcriptional activator protein n=1 Tax=Tomato leaf curl Kunene virus TaxID=2740451 RepID=A0A7D3QM89_9GEMI|nr:transcriptional activator protein [Tomato leaf curl Kunene virus]QKE61402.1 transcriptional activator protein [Tomato leaf curl Kunene virus]
MRSSSPSTSRSTQVPIKVRHKIGKAKAVRRKRIDLDCGCSFFIHINCALNGFAHRGRHHCSSSMEWRLLLGSTQSPVLQDNETRPEAIPMQPRHHINTNTVQPQPQEGFGDSQMFSELPDLDGLTSSDWSFLKCI